MSNLKTKKTMANLEELFGIATTENGDTCFTTTHNALLDILFMTEYYNNHLDEVKIGNSIFERWFAMFIRDPRYGIGKRDLGRVLLKQSGASFDDIAACGRYDDLIFIFKDDEDNFVPMCNYLREKIENGDELAKKWMPRYSSKNMLLARKIAMTWGMNKQQYGKFIKTHTTEFNLTHKEYDEIEFSKIPSLALLKYANAFLKHEELSERFKKYQMDVMLGDAKINVTTTGVYDIYKNCDKINADILFANIKKAYGNWIPICDTSSSMFTNDAFGKAMAISHYLAKTSTFMPNKVITFSSNPHLIDLETSPNGMWKIEEFERMYPDYVNTNMPDMPFRRSNSKYAEELKRMYTGDTSNTNFGAVMQLLKGLDYDNAPEFLVVVSDNEFDANSSASKDETMTLFHENDFKTKIVWWNLNSRRKTVPETDEYGNIFMSGYNPSLLAYLESGFNGEQYLYNLIETYMSHFKS